MALPPSGYVGAQGRVMQLPAPARGRRVKKVKKGGGEGFPPLSPPPPLSLPDLTGTDRPLTHPCGGVSRMLKQSHHIVHDQVDISKSLKSVTC